jgi:hypothetical protein
VSRVAPPTISVHTTRAATITSQMRTPRRLEVVFVVRSVVAEVI